MKTLRLGLNLSLQSKLTLLVCAIAICIASFIGVFNYSRTLASSRSMAIESLAIETKLTSQQFKDAFDNMRNDIFVVSGTPPIQGIIRAKMNNGIDPVDGSGVDLWYDRLSQIFSSVMKERPFYTQMRFIGVSEEGKEIVRVNRVDDQLETVPRDSLQSKANEPYMKNLELLEKGEVYFSDITFNRELNDIDHDLIPTLRATMIVYDEAEHLFGVLVINSDYALMLRDIISAASPTHNAFVINHLGDYIEYESSGLIGEFEMHGAYSKEPPTFMKKVQESHAEEASFTESDNIAYFTKMNITHRNANAYLGTVLQVPSEEVMAYANDIRDKTLLYTIFLIVGSTIFSLLITRSFLSPLRKITRVIRETGDDKIGMNLPVHLRDEIGELARTLQRAIIGLQKSEAKFRLLLESAPDAMVMVDGNGLIQLANTETEKMFGYHKMEMIGQKVEMLMPERYRGNHLAHRAGYLNNPKVRPMGTGMELFGIKKDKTEFPIEISLSPLETEEETLVTAAIRDLTIRKKGEAEREKLIKALELSNKELDEFAYVASHDLKAPLRVIDNASNWLAEDLIDQMDEESKENIQLLRSRVQRMEKLLDDLLEYSRIGRKKDDRFEEIIDGETLLDDVLLLLSPPETFQVVADEHFKKLMVNRMPIHQILYNLINNAIKHHHRDRGKINVVLSEHVEEYKCCVSDDGPGIPDKYKSKIFEMFQTLKPRDQVEGSGMGLAMVKKHVEQMGGNIGVESKEGQGAIFWFAWPKSINKG